MGETRFLYGSLASCIDGVGVHEKEIDRYSFNTINYGKRKEIYYM